jgi:CheY-like chemotaxis protein
MAKILVVEDEPGIALGIETALQAEGYAVTVVSDGEQAVRRARAEAFDLILLDVMLPHKDGFRGLLELRNGGLATPIVMLTAKTGEFDKVLGLDLGADDYITKPFSPRELRAQIRTALRHQPGAASLSATQFGERCGALLSELNELLYKLTGNGVYATAFHAVYDATLRLLTYVNAGQEAPLLWRATAEGGQCLRLESRTIPLGLFPTVPALETRLQLVPGDWLVIFTDGVSEAPNENGEEFGAAGLMAVAEGIIGAQSGRNARCDD